MPLKIMKFVGNCGECDNYRYNSAGTYICAPVEQIIRDKDTIPAFCPLTDFPAKTLSDLESTVRAMQEPNRYGLTCAVLTHIASKLKTTLSDNFVLRISLKETMGAVYLNPNFITKVEFNPWTIYFSNQVDQEYRLFPDYTEHKLEKKVLLDGSETPAWLNVDLA